MDIREKIIRKTAIYFKENTLDDLCLFMENILDFQKNCLKESLKTLRKAEEDIKSNFRIYLNDDEIDECIKREFLILETYLKNEIMANFEEKLNEENFMKDIHPGLYFQLIFVLDKIVNEELKKVWDE